ncbi:decarboxylase [Roseobacter denitrificans]|uniref:Tyrosine decarboxylase, putative n=1 Tax=Roseobacter denitrificans (strain ATCC 33942 / OCh 114) TaxID=375451 RepID=Q165W5_ROSDO|nr:pyridoxal-dependent decarboxylase [Roseobacter denitrificans]ABG32228.1 tyrosine decarboxylase, putative [Roseobacter denitrificans OCh 114]AVL51723.1 decarboxylase [Roseobacter denitrificans]SFF78987.1 Pyridoxal-dependent decarboxylase conserved domain-containing protein [Roseobacter denitrificans OCh 114]
MVINRQRTKLVRDIDEFRRDAFQDKLSLDRPGGSMPAAWFLGPKAENEKFLRDMITLAIDEAVKARHDFHPDDPSTPSLAELEEDGYNTGRDLFESRFREVLGFLRGSVPMASYRNQSHMYWDTTLPSVVGYFATMLYNQNNCTPEASPITTALEMAVGDDLCRMLGYEIPDREDVRHGAIRPWGHITCDGSVANIESMWAARNIKYLPVGLAAAIRHDPDMADARDVTVSTLQGKRRRLLDLDNWSLLNLPIDQAIKLPARISKTAGIPEDVLKAALAAYSVQDLGLLEFHRQFLPDTPAPVVMAPATAHYSWSKAVSLLGLGRAALHGIRVDLDARTDPVHLRRMLEDCLKEGRPVVQVVAVVGSTEESAVDPLHEIVKIRNEFRERGLEFALHADGAWGGYFASMLRQSNLDRQYDAAETEEEREEVERLIIKTYGVDNPEIDPDVPALRDWESKAIFNRRNTMFAPGIDLNEYVRRQYHALQHCDTITVDPHKGGFVVYPAGALCYRNGALRQLIAFASPVVQHGDIAQSVGFYGVEGSKPGAAATAVYLSHSLIPADRYGYGALLGKCMFASKRFYAGLVSMAREDDPFYVTTFQRLPAERVGAPRSAVRRQIDLIRNEIVKPITDDELLTALSKDFELRELFSEMGSDQCIVAYSFNYLNGFAQNRKISRLNEMNERMFEAMSIQKFNDGAVPDVDLLVTASSFDPEVYGQDFVDSYARRIGVNPEPGVGIKFLISTQQNPWLTRADDGKLLPRLIEVLRDVATEAAEYVMAQHKDDYGQEFYHTGVSGYQGPDLPHPDAAPAPSATRKP